MIARHRPVPYQRPKAGARALSSLAAAVALLLASGAQAADEPAAPSDAPADAAPFDAPFEVLPADGGAYDPAFDASLPELPAPAPADTGPVWEPPAIDAYVDLSFNDADFSDYGYADTPGGYRFVAGFRLEKMTTARFTFAPEIGYLRFGKGEEESVTRTLNIPIPQYENIRTEIDSLDLSTLTFGVRAGYRVLGPLETYARGGAHFYHVSRQEEVTLSYVPIPPNTTPRSDFILPTRSETEVGTNAYAALGVGWQLGPLPTAYLEYGVYAAEGGTISLTSFGFLLNF